jgi:PIN domain nuclease of toxin-antitoxin system
VGSSARLKLLLDTHIWLWLLQDLKRIGRRTLRTLGDESNELWLSPISAWEALTHHYKGKIRIQEDMASWLDRAIAGTLEAPLTHQISLVARQLPLHEDPADRILAATAQVLYYLLFFDNIQQEEVCVFLRELLRHLRGPVIVLPDNSSTHKGEPLQKLLRQHPRLSIEYFPSYAPDLNPDEGECGLWLKGTSPTAALRMSMS